MGQGRGGRRGRRLTRMGHSRRNDLNQSWRLGNPAPDRELPSALDRVAASRAPSRRRVLAGCDRGQTTRRDLRAAARRAPAAASPAVRAAPRDSLRVTRTDRLAHATDAVRPPVPTRARWRWASGRSCKSVARNSSGRSRQCLERRTSRLIGGGSAVQDTIGQLPSRIDLNGSSRIRPAAGLRSSHAIEDWVSESRWLAGSPRVAQSATRNQSWAIRLAHKPKGFYMKRLIMMLLLVALAIPATGRWRCGGRGQCGHAQH